ncbi:alpha carbonic anhydrase 8 [Pyrus x bretschneideri]|uniref:alpha carbonic anhydrase 8 n=1 Tax=Pyrus x bretschneideri TaxID=225117 RepID=UPI00202E3650|nr:alpha carbonic anhydrase 8 [Pyrus x bretschneideri]
MSRFIELVSPLLLAFLLVQFSTAVSSSSPPEPSPTPSPQTGADAPSPPSPSPISLPPSPSNAPADSPIPSSPPAPPQSTPSPSPDSEPSVPSSAPSVPSDINHNNINADGDGEEFSEGGISTGKKAGIAFGVIVGVSLVGLGGFVYKKRQDNVRRSQYGYAARREIL